MTRRTRSLGRDAGLLGVALAALAALGSASGDEAFRAQREAMVARIEAYEPIPGKDSGRFARRVLDGLARVPRHHFVPGVEKAAAYENRPLPIGHGQTISQPYIVALMTELAAVDDDDLVLEIGTGSGYQAAVLSTLVKRVYSIEIIEALGDRASALLDRLGYGNVECRVGDGYYGWPEHGPFDAIVVTAAASHIPPPLVAQLKPGGRMVIPVGGAFLTQQLTLVEKDRKGTVRTRQLLPVRFVPLTGGP
ncbi:MAG: protein-L-isoaspartate(D-aspartate) O-methyltransferase [Candidatus Binatia bacterium]